jgi:type IV secretory pathway ATPase VirB11/archaellum biosynthesis ATPase
MLNDFWPWRGTLRGQLTVADLLASATLTPEVTATVWWSIDQGASVFVAAGPQGAGKSTVANAFLEFLPDDAHVYVTSGGRDRLEVPPTPGPVYLLVNELSAHMPVYLYGAAAQRAFELLKSGVRMLGTLHARSAADALRVMCLEAELARTEFSTPFLFAVMSAGWSGQHIVRRVVELGFLAPTGELTTLTEAGPDGLKPHSAGFEALASWSTLGAAEVQRAIAGRARQLASVTTPSAAPRTL